MDFREMTRSSPTIQISEARRREMARDSCWTAIAEDWKAEFVSILNEEFEYLTDIASDIICEVFYHNAIGCAEALITGETPLTVDIDLPTCTYTGLPPLHFVAFSFFTSPAPMIEFLLYYRARTDIRFDPHCHAPITSTIADDHRISDRWEAIELCTNRLPLQIAVDAMENGRSCNMVEWSPEESIYKLITKFCLPERQNQLEKIALSEELGEVFLEYATEGKIVELTSLLIVAPKEKLYDVIDTVHQYLDSKMKDPSLVEEDRVKLVSMKQLLLVFDAAGNDISSYAKQYKSEGCDFDTEGNVKCLLTKAGFLVSDVDVDVGEDNWNFCWGDGSNKCLCRRKGMMKIVVQMTLRWHTMERQAIDGRCQTRIHSSIMRG